MSQSDMITSEAARRYASALLDLADEAKALKTVEKDMGTLKAMFAASVDLSDSLNSPVISNEDKQAVVAALAKKAKMGKLVSNFIGTVAQNSRAGELPLIITAFEQQLAEMRGTQTAQLVSAKKLTAAELAAIKKQIKSTIGSDIKVETRVDPSLLGGFAVKIGSRYFDSSLKTKLEGMKLAMKEA